MALSSYKIPAQKTEDGKDVAEGTLIFDKDANTLSICIGKPYNAMEPATAFTMPVQEEIPVVVTTKNKTAKTKIKTIAQPKPWMYTGTKVEKATVMN